MHSGGAYVATDTAVLYRPYLRDFVSTAQTMTVPRARATATLLPDRTILIARARSSNESEAAYLRYLNSAELYDYRTGQFTATGT